MSEEFPQQQPPVDGQEQLDQNLGNPQPEGQVMPDAQAVEAPLTGSEVTENTDSEPADDSEPTHLGTIDHGDETNNRWDEQKAETLANVILDDQNNNKQYNRFVKARDKKTEHPKEMNRNIKGKLEDIETGEYEPRENESTNSTKKRLESTMAYHNETIGEANAEVEENVTELLTPFEELYDVNPDHFANMPTSEFMALAKDAKEHQDKIEFDEWKGENLEFIFGSLQDAIDTREPVDINKMTGLLRDNVLRLFKAEDRADLLNKAKAITQDTFDKTPRQMVEEFKAVAEEASKLVTEKTEEDRRAKEDFLNQFRPKEGGASESTERNG